MKSVCFANVKGGVGKSSLTIVTANFLSDMNFSVAIVDCDIAQKTCFNAWELTDNPTYDVIVFDPGTNESGWKNLINEISGYDYVFFDIPGSVFQSGVITLLQLMDKVIVLTRCSPKDLSSTDRFIQDVLRANDVNKFKVVLNMLRPYRDASQKDALEEIQRGVRGTVAEVLNVEPDFFFKNHILDEQAAIEKNMQIGEIHEKLRSRYSSFFEELVEYVEQEETIEP